MKDLLLGFSIGILSGTVAGLLSSMIIYLYSEKRTKIRKIIEYAEKIEEKTQLVKEEIDEYLEGKSLDEYLEGKSLYVLKYLLKKEVNRSFPGLIDDKSELSQELVRAIQMCNDELDKVKEALEKDNYHNDFFHATGRLGDALIKIGNVIVQFDSFEENRIARFRKLCKDWIPRVIIVFSLILILAIFI